MLLIFKAKTAPFLAAKKGGIALLKYPRGQRCKYRHYFRYYKAGSQSPGGKGSQGGKGSGSHGGNSQAAGSIGGSSQGSGAGVPSWAMGVVCFPSFILYAVRVTNIREFVANLVEAVQYAGPV